MKKDNIQTHNRNTINRTNIKQKQGLYYNNNNNNNNAVKIRAGLRDWSAGQLPGNPTSKRC
jgi:hypothetical protein